MVSDWNMPALIGIELLKALRASDGLMTPPALMVTAAAKQETSSKRFRVNNYIAMPHNAATLQE